MTIDFPCLMPRDPLEVEHELYALRMYLCICSPNHVKGKLRTQVKNQARLGVLSKLDNDLLNTTLEVARTRGIER